MGVRDLRLNIVGVEESGLQTFYLSSNVIDYSELLDSWRWRWCVSSNCLEFITLLLGVTTQKTESWCGNIWRGEWFVQNEVTINTDIRGSRNNKVDLVFEEIEFILYLFGV